MVISLSHLLFLKSSPCGPPAPADLSPIAWCLSFGGSKRYLPEHPSFYSLSLAHILYQSLQALWEAVLLAELLFPLYIWQATTPTPVSLTPHMLMTHRITSFTQPGNLHCKPMEQPLSVPPAPHWWSGAELVVLAIKLVAILGLEGLTCSLYPSPWPLAQQKPLPTQEHLPSSSLLRLMVFSLPRARLWHGLRCTTMEILQLPCHPSSDHSDTLRFCCNYLWTLMGSGTQAIPQNPRTWLPQSLPGGIRQHNPEEDS